MRDSLAASTIVLRSYTGPREARPSFLAIEHGSASLEATAHDRLDPRKEHVRHLLGTDCKTFSCYVNIRIPLLEALDERSRRQSQCGGVRQCAAHAAHAAHACSREVCVAPRRSTHTLTRYANYL